MNPNVVTNIKSIGELHGYLGLSSPKHPLISLVNVEDVVFPDIDHDFRYTQAFYFISMKKGVNDKIQYGQNHYDFDDGIVALIRPNQVIKLNPVKSKSTSGWMLMFHPDFIAGYPLAEKINQYGFFAYEIHEALHLSDTEERSLLGIMKNIQKEYDQAIDKYSQDVILAHLELLLSYINRYYGRQFVTRKNANTGLLSTFDRILEGHFKDGYALMNGLPSVGEFAKELKVSKSYLNDLIKSTQGCTTQQYIQIAIVENAKRKLSSTKMSVSEIAYSLGFQYSQSFNKFFKKHTGITPLFYRSSFN
ncbi:MAG: helix-turn-helix domain-containing protein [Bacteroidota bacterium]